VKKKAGRSGGSDDPKSELLRFLRGLDLPPPAEITEETSLLRSGLFDSLALFHLTEWIERRLGEPVDPSTIDLVEEWDSVSRIVDFLRRRGGGGEGPVS
jgi:acyl carrier protein